MREDMGWASNVIDPDVYLAWHEALAKQGYMSFALKKAYERLPVLLSMKPETVEAYFSTRMDEV